jgi:DNA-binding transcriptional LysR family regulator
MDFRQLGYIAVLAEERHFGRAARRLDMSQPALSAAIKQIEAELGTQLFLRDSRNVEVTRAGRALEGEARLLLRQFDETKALVQAVAEGKEGRLRVGFGALMLLKGLPQMIDRFRSENPGIDLRLMELSSAEQIAAIKRDEIDFGFVLGESGATEVNGFRLHAEPFVACVPLGHPLAKAKTFNLEWLKEHKFVSLSRAASPHYYERVASICEMYGFSPDVRYEFDRAASVVLFVASGMGVALVPKAASKRSVSGTKFIDFTGPHDPVETWCIWKDVDQRPGLKSMIDMCQAHAQNNGSSIATVCR